LTDGINVVELTTIHWHHHARIGVSKIDDGQIDSFCRRKNVPTESLTEQHCEHGVLGSTVAEKMRKMSQNHQGQNHEDRNERHHWPHDSPTAARPSNIRPSNVCQTENDQDKPAEMAPVTLISV